MTAFKFGVKLTPSEREHLLGVTRRGTPSARKVKRALILCKADEGLSDREIAQSLVPQRLAAHVNAL